MVRYVPLVLLSHLAESCSGSEDDFFGNYTELEGFTVEDQFSLQDSGDLAEDNLPRISLNDLVQAGRWHVDDQERSVYESGEFGLPLSIFDLELAECQDNGSYSVCKGKLGNNPVVGFKKSGLDVSLFYVANSQTEIGLVSFPDPATPGLMGYLYDSFGDSSEIVTRLRVTDLDKMFSHYEDGGIENVWARINDSGGKINMIVHGETLPSSEELDSLVVNISPLDGYVVRACSVQLIPKQESYGTTACLVSENAATNIIEGDVYLGGTEAAIIGGQIVEDIGKTMLSFDLHDEILRHYRY